jgi:hypothetical protein
MRSILCTYTLASVLVVASAGAQSSTRLSLVFGPQRIDKLAESPVAPTLGLAKPVGRHGVLGGRLGWIRDAGFYGLDALTLDLDAGLKTRPATMEWHATAGPWAMLGSDGDGTPYTHVGGQATVGLTWWPSNRLGLLGSASGRLWLSRSDERLTPGALVGLVIRRQTPALATTSRLRAVSLGR